MKIKLTTLGTLLLLCRFAIGTHAAAFTTGNVVVSQYGDGVTTLTSAAAAVSVLEYTPSGSLVQTINIPSSGVGQQLTGAGNSGTENYISRSTDGTILTFGGYDAPAATLAVAGTTAATVNRVVEKVDVNGNYSRVVTGTSTMYNTANIRSTVSDGVNYWMAGSSGGEWYSANGGTPVQISATTPSNARVIRIFNGTLYVSSGSSPNVGVNAFSGIPTSSTTSPTLIIPNGGSPYDFAINPAGAVAYVADSSAGLQKWVYSGGSWTKKFTFGTANGLTASADGVAVDFSGPNPVIYTTTGESTANTLRKITDTSALTATSDTTDQATTLATAPALTTFKGVTFAPSAAPVMISQPSDSLNNITNTTFSLSVVTTTGGQTLHYQWYSPDLNTSLVDGSYHGGTISGSTTETLQFSSAAIAQSGNYQVIVTNVTGSVTSRVAQVTVIAQPVPPTIDSNITPTGSTNIIGDSVGFSVTAHGVPDVAYQWKWIPDTNNAVTNIIIGANSASLPLSNLTTNQSGKYFVTITNTTAYYTTNSAQAYLKVNPSPSLTIAQLRAMVDGSYNPTNTAAYYTIQGTVTTWTNMTTSAAPQFFMQDSAAGIMVYWANAGGSNCPPAGAVVRVTGTLSSYQGNLEMNPNYNSPSTGNPLPAAQALPFDPNITGSVATMKMLEGTYFVASNVTLLAGSKFVSTSGGEQMTNNVYHIKTDGMYALQFTNGAGQTFTFYINSYVGIVGQPKPAGPVTIYGVLQEYYGAYEFLPTRYADIISYNSQSNVVSNVVRAGDLLTNSYTENKLLTGETLTARVSIGDPEGGNVTLLPSMAGLPGSASWSGVTSGSTGTAVFHFTPTTGDAGSNYVVAVGVNSTSGNSFSNLFTVYVPTTNEQQIAISEFLANPTTNTGAANFNPLQRASDTVGISTNDEYIEIASQAANDTYLLGWGIYSGSTKVEDFSLNGPTLSSSNCVVVDGSDASGMPSFPAAYTGYNEPATSGGLLLSSSGSTIILRDQNGYIVDRVVYAAGDLSTNGSLERFPTLNSAFVPSPYVSTNVTSAGLQYDGSPWNQPFKVPAGVPGVGISVGNGQVVFNFTANTGQASTLWGASTVAGPYSVIFGRQFPTTSGAFTNPAPTALRFYYISTQ
jgi:hypothetical protein